MLNDETVDRTAEHAGRPALDENDSSAAKAGGVLTAFDPCAMLRDLSLGNLEATLKATDIFARGLKMMNTALVGSTLMAMDDAIADARTAMSCHSLQQFVALEADTAPVLIRRYFSHASVLCRMATQLVQDALFPLERRVGLAFDLFGRKVL